MKTSFNYGRIEKEEEKEARQYPTYNPHKNNWTWNVKGTRLGQFEISIIRSNYRLGFVSYGYHKPDKKIIVCSSYETETLPVFMFTCFKILAREGAKIMNNIPKDKRR